MKIKIENFGPIHSFEMDLDKDMHILYGENNVGKSYAISMVFLILRKLEDMSHLVSGYGPFSFEGMAISNSNIPAGQEHELNEIFKYQLKNIFTESFIPGLIGGMISTRGDASTWVNRLNAHDAAITLDFDFFSICIRSDDQKTLVVDSVNLGITYLLTATRKDGQNENQVTFWLMEEQEGDPPFVYSSNDNCLISTALIKVTTRRSYYLPAARSGIYSGLSGLSFIFAKLSQIRHLLAGERIDLPYLPEPSSEFFLQISSINGQPKTQLTDIVAKMEQELIQGEVHFDTLSKRLKYYQPSIGITFELEQTSSMVAEMAIMIGFLKFVLDPLTVHNQQNKGYHNRRFATLLIEEPEAHLHPEVQVKLMAYLAELSKLGVKVVITTHSNYMFNKASNLILKGDLEEEKVANYHMIMTDKGSIVNPKDTLHDWGMEDENFVDVAEDLLDERLQAAEDFNANVTR